MRYSFWRFLRCSCVSACAIHAMLPALRTIHIAFCVSNHRCCLIFISYIIFSNGCPEYWLTAGWHFHSVKRPRSRHSRDKIGKKLDESIFELCEFRIIFFLLYFLNIFAWIFIVFSLFLALLAIGCHLCTSQENILMEYMCFFFFGMYENPLQSAMVIMVMMSSVPSAVFIRIKIPLCGWLTAIISYILSQWLFTRLLKFGEDDNPTCNTKMIAHAMCVGCGMIHISIDIPFPSVSRRLCGVTLPTLWMLAVDTICFWTESWWKTFKCRLRLAFFFFFISRR